jgi:hypothetical protein
VLISTIQVLKLHQLQHFYFTEGFSKTTAVTLEMMGTLIAEVTSPAVLAAVTSGTLATAGVSTAVKTSPTAGPNSKQKTSGIYQGMPTTGT